MGPCMIVISVDLCKHVLVLPSLPRRRLAPSAESLGQRRLERLVPHGGTRH